MSIPIDKSLYDIRQDLFDRISTVQDGGWLPAKLNLNKGVVRGLVELWAWGLYQLYQFMVVVFAQLFAALATGKWLDLHCAQVGVARQKATKALGSVTFFRDDTDGNVSIPAGNIVKTKPDGAGVVHRFVVQQAVVLPAGSQSVIVDVESEDYGTQANVTAGQICEIPTVIAGVDGVVNGDDWLFREAVDQEDDDQLRERYVLAWQALNGSTKHAYQSWARNVSGVVAVSVLDRHPRGQGTVDVVIKGSAGIPTQALIDDVDVVVQTNRPINDDALVIGPVPESFDLDAELIFTSGAPALIIAEVEERINAMFTDPAIMDDVSPIEIGEDLTMDRLRFVMMAVSGIKKINFTSPAADIQVNDDALAVLSSVNLSYAWAGEA